MTQQRKRIRTSRSVQESARILRQRMTPAERLLWECLRNRKLGGYKFRRQHPLGPFVADFCCAERRLIVEVDGGVHCGRAERDAARTAQFKQHNYRVIRFSNEQVLRDLEGVLKTISATCSEESDANDRC